MLVAHHEECTAGMEVVRQEVEMELKTYGKIINPEDAGDAKASKDGNADAKAQD